MVFILFLMVLPSLSAQPQTPAAPPSEQQNSASPAPEADAARPPGTATFRSQSSYVTVPVVVTDTYGIHFPGLNKEDFVVKQNGKPQRIDHLQEFRAASSGPVRRLPQPPEIFTNQLEPQSPQRLVILAVDAINTALMDQSYARAELLQAVGKGIAPNELVSLVSVGQGGRIKVLHDFTTDSSVLLAALRRVRPRSNTVANIQADEAEAITWEAQAEVAALTDWQTEMARRMGEKSQVEASEQGWIAVQDTLSAFQQIADAYTGVPGRKELLWMTSGFPFTLSGDLSTIEDVLPGYEAAWQALIQANIAVYPIDVQGLINAGFVGADMATPRNPISGGTSPQAADLMRGRQIDAYYDTHATMDMFAGMTGGRAFYNTNDLAGAVRKAAEISGSYYLIGYYLDKKTKPGWQKLQVQVIRPGTLVSARSGFFVGPALSPDARREADLRGALNSPIDFTALPVSVRWAETAPAPGSPKQTRKFQIALPAGAEAIDETDGNRMRLEFLAVARDDAGKVAGQFAQKIDQRLTPEALSQLRAHPAIFEYSIDLPPGDYRVRFVARDDLTGRMGSVSAPVKVP
jgi:VWFA-related protein